MNHKSEFEPIATHFFEQGPYEVWAFPYWGARKKVLVASGLSLQTARSYNWAGKEICLDGKEVK
jgi:hypothetical protein